MDLNTESVLATGWRTSWPTKVVVHGFTSNIESRIIQDIKNGKRNTHSYTVLTSVRPSMTAGVRLSML